jgi:septal ring factor EnvC (AmiA/AmiB activator)
VRALERRLKRLERELAATKARYERRIENARRAANRRLAAMVQEIATLRHHEARAETLARLLASGGSSPATPTAVPEQGRGNGEDPRLPG